MIYSKPCSVVKMVEPAVRCVSTMLKKRTKNAKINYTTAKLLDNQMQTLNIQTGWHTYSMQINMYIYVYQHLLLGGAHLKTEYWKMVNCRPVALFFTAGTSIDGLHPGILLLGFTWAVSMPNLRIWRRVNEINWNQHIVDKLTNK